MWTCCRTWSWRPLTRRPKKSTRNLSPRWAGCLAAWVCRRECSKATMDLAEPMARLIDEFKRLPGIGQKSAQRMAFHVLSAPREEAERLAEALVSLKDRMRLCAACNNISDSELCPICS